MKRHRVDDAPGDSGGVRPKREKQWYNKDKGDQSASFVRESVGETHAKSLTQYKQEDSSCKKRNCVSVVTAQDTGKQCRSRGCFKCKSKHHTSLCDKDKNRPPGDNVTVLTSYSPSADEWSLPTIIPVKTKGEIFWAYLDTGAGRNFITSEAAKRLNLKAERHEVREILTVNDTMRQSLPIFNLLIELLDGKESEKIQLTGTKLRDFTTVRRPDINKLKEQYEQYQRQIGDVYPIHVILGDSTYCPIRTEEVYIYSRKSQLWKERHLAG